MGTEPGAGPAQQQRVYPLQSWAAAASSSSHTQLWCLTLPQSGIALQLKYVIMDPEDFPNIKKQ